MEDLNRNYKISKTAKIVNVEVAVSVSLVLTVLVSIFGGILYWVSVRIKKKYMQHWNVFKVKTV